MLCKKLKNFVGCVALLKTVKEVLNVVESAKNCNPGPDVLGLCPSMLTAGVGPCHVCVKESSLAL